MKPISGKESLQQVVISLTTFRSSCSKFVMEISNCLIRPSFSSFESKRVNLLLNRLSRYPDFLCKRTFMLKTYVC